MTIHALLSRRDTRSVLAAPGARTGPGGWIR